MQKEKLSGLPTSSCFLYQTRFPWAATQLRGGTANSLGKEEKPRGLVLGDGSGALSGSSGVWVVEVEGEGEESDGAAGRRGRVLLGDREETRVPTPLGRSCFG